MPDLMLLLQHGILYGALYGPTGAPADQPYSAHLPQAACSHWQGQRGWRSLGSVSRASLVWLYVGYNSKGKPKNGSRRRWA